MILRIQTTLFSCVLTNSERDLYPFALVFSFAEIIEAAASSAPNPCSWSSNSGCVGWFSESVVGRILGSGCRIETVVGSLCVSSGCTSYPHCLQQVIGWSSASYPTSWRPGQRPHQIPLWCTMKPRNCPADTPNAHLLGFIFKPCFLVHSNTFRKSARCFVKSPDLTTTSSI